MYICNICNYETNARTALYNHKKSQKHLYKIKILEENKTNELKDNKIKELEEKIKELEKNIIKLTLEKDFIMSHSTKIKINKYKVKDKIPATVKNTLWRKYFNDNINGKCYCCKIENISIKNFDCGHVISEKNGGDISLDNLRPICRLCNSSMSTINMDEFIKKFGFDDNLK